MWLWAAVAEVVVVGDGSEANERAAASLFLRSPSDSSFPEQ